MGRDTVDVWCRVNDRRTNRTEQRFRGGTLVFETLRLDCTRDAPDGFTLGEVRTELEYRRLKDRIACNVGFIRAEPRGKGFGSAALPHILDRLADEGCTSVHGFILREAEGFWSKVGLTPIKRDINFEMEAE